MILLPRYVSRIATLAAREEARYSLTGVRILQLADGCWRLEASDGKRAAIVRGQSVPSPAEEARYAELPDFGAAAACEGIVPLDAWKKALVAAKKERLGVVLAANEAILATLDSQVRTRLVEGRYPDFSMILPKKPARFAITVNAKQLAEMLLAAAELSSARGESTDAVELLFWHPDQPMGVISQGPDGTTFDGLLMPLT